MRHLVKFSAAMLVTGLLSACGTTGQPVVEVQEEAVASEPQTPELASLFFTWPLGEIILIAPPVAIQTKAIAACRAKGYDTGYMINIRIDGDDAVGEFGCRGADQ